MIILKAAEKQGFTLSLEDTILEKIEKNKKMTANHSKSSNLNGK